jgi:hypothetical protein
MEQNKKKFTVVVPTMWRYPPFINFLRDLTDFDMVDDIIIHNNDFTKTPKSTVFNHPKITLINHRENIFVNPAFNHGVKHAKNDNVCLLNDDIIFDFKVFYHVARVLNEHSGVIGICPGLEQFKQPPFTSGSINIVPWKTGDHTFGFGCLMFVNKGWWIPIPDEFLIYYGDNWIFDTCLIRKRQNYLITDSLFHTPYASTTKDLEVANEMMKKETAVYRQRIEDFHRWVQGD